MEEPIDYSLVPLRIGGKIVKVSARIRGVLFVPMTKGEMVYSYGIAEAGTQVFYPGLKKPRIIFNSRYENIEEDFGLGTREEKTKFTRGLERVNKRRIG